MDRAFVSSPWSCRQAPSSPEASPSGEAIASMSRGRGSRQRCVFCILWDIVGNMLWDIVDIVGNMLWDIVGYVVGNMLWEICCGKYVGKYVVGYCGKYVVGNMLWDIVGNCGILWELCCGNYVVGYCGILWDTVFIPGIWDIVGE